MKNTERIAWGVGVAVVMAWGITRKPPVIAEGSSLPTTEERGRERFRSSSRLESGELAVRRSGGREDDTRSGSDSGRVLRHADPLQRASGFLRMLAACDTKGLEEMRVAFDELKASGIALPAEEGWLDFRMGQLEGAELLEGRKGSSKDMAELPKLSKTFEGWVHADPYAAGYWLEGLQPGKFRDRMAMIHIGASAKDDPANAMKHASALHPSQRGAAGREVAGRLAETLSLQEASSVLDSMKTGASGGNDAYLSSLFDGIMAHAVKGDASAAISLAEAHMGQPYASGASLSRVSSALAQENPVKALEWAAKMDEKKGGDGSMLSGTIKGMTLDGLDEAETWVAARSDGSSETLLIDIDRRRKNLEDRGGENASYDKED